MAENGFQNEFYIPLFARVTIENTGTGNRARKAFGTQGSIQVMRFKELITNLDFC